MYSHQSYFYFDLMAQSDTAGAGNVLSAVHIYMHACGCSLQQITTCAHPLNHVLANSQHTLTIVFYMVYTAPATSLHDSTLMHIWTLFYVSCWLEQMNSYLIICTKRGFWSLKVAI